MMGHSHSSNLNGDGSINYNGDSWFSFDDQTVSGDEYGHKKMPQFYVFEMRGINRCLQMIRIKVILHLE